jgi:hypothetical protein
MIIETEQICRFFRTYQKIIKIYRPKYMLDFILDRMFNRSSLQVPLFAEN